MRNMTLSALEIFFLAAAIVLAAAPHARADDYDDQWAAQSYRQQQIDALDAQARAQEEIARQIQQQNADRIFERAWQGNRNYR